MTSIVRYERDGAGVVDVRGGSRAVKGVGVHFRQEYRIPESDPTRAQPLLAFRIASAEDCKGPIGPKHDEQRS